MNRFFRNPITNAVGISIFTAFYGVIFLGFSNLITSQTGISTSPFWKAWDDFLTIGGYKYIAIILIAITIFIVAILLLKHKPYDEYHTTILIKCLAISVILTLGAIAIFFIAILIDPVGIISKFTLFISLNWTTVVLADLIYLLLCRRK